MAPIIRKKLEKGPPGRPKHEVWTLGFKRVIKTDEKNHKSIHAALCVICSKILCNTASKRLMAHRRICAFDRCDISKVEDDQESTKILITDETGNLAYVDYDESQHGQLMADQSGSDATKTEYMFVDDPSESFEEYKIQSHVTINNASDSKFDLTFVKFFIGCNIPFSVADSSYFKKMCLALNPEAKLITSEQLSGPLLDLAYSKIHKDINIGPLSVLLIDGWKNEGTNSKNITAMIKTESNEILFLDNYELTNNKDLARELTDITSMCINEATERFKTKIYAVVLGNSVSLIKMDDLNEVWQFPSNVHVLKILTKEYLKTIPSGIMSTVFKILKELNSIIKDEELDTKLSGEYGWSNVKFILEYCIKNIELIKHVLESNDSIKLSKDYKCLFFDEPFVSKIESYNSFMESINELTSICHTPKSTIADIIEEWLGIQFSHEDPELNKNLSVKRESVMKIECLVANYLHPVYRGRKLSEDQLSKVEMFLVNELGSDGLNSLNCFISGHDGIFKALDQKEGLSPQIYWSLVKRTHKDLATLALKLLAIPASITWNFSQIFNSIKNNSLKPEKMRKLSAVYHHLKKKEEKVEIE